MATINSAATGNWSSTSTWSGGVVPVLGDKAIIQTGHVVTVDGTYSVGDDQSSNTANSNSLVLLGTLKASRSVNSQLTVRGTLAFNANGVLDYGKAGDIIPDGVTATIIINDSATLAAGKHGITMLSSTATKIWMRGIAKTRNTTLTATISAGAVNPTIQVAAAANWKVGDRIALASDNYDYNNAGALLVSAVSGTSITLSGTVTQARSIGCSVGNLSSNVTVKSASANHPGIFRTLITGVGNFDVGDMAIENVGNASGWTTTGSSTPDNSAGLGVGTSANQTFDQVIDNVAIYMTSTASTYAAARYSVAVGKTTFSNWAIFTNVSGNGIYLGDSCYLDINDCIIYKMPGTAINTGYGAGSGLTNVNGGKFWCATGVGTSGLQINMNNCYLRCNTSLASSNAMIGLSFFGCDLFSNVRTWAPTNPGALFGPAFYDCIFNGTAISRSGSTVQGAQSANCIVYRPDGDANDYRAFSWYHYSQTDTSTKYRGTRSFKMKPEQADTAFYYRFTLPAISGVARRYIGYLRFDTAFGTTYPAYIKLSGQGVNEVFNAPATADTWHKFDLTVTPTSTGDITVELGGQSTGATGYMWLDGLAITPWIESTRHYGFQFNLQPYRTIDAVIEASSEVTVGAYTGIAINHATDTVTITANHTVRELYDYIKLNLCQPSNLSEPDFFTSNDGTNFTCTYDIVVNNATLTGSGQISMAANLFTLSGTGSTTLNVVDSTGTKVNITATGFITGARIQVYNLTDNSEIYNAIPASSPLAIPITWATDKSLRVRMTRVSGTDADLPIESLASLTNTGASVTLSPQPDTVYETNAINGSAITEFTADYGSIQIDANDVDGYTSVKRLYAWYTYLLMSSQGIADFYGGLIAEDVANYRIEDSVVDIKIQNISSTPLIINEARLYRADGTSIFAAGTGPAQHDPLKAYVANSDNLLTFDDFIALK